MLSQKKISEIVDENYVFASVLYFFGINFYDYSEETLENVCNKKGLNVKSVVRDLENVNQNGPAHNHFLRKLPVDLVIEYLKHSHYVLIKKRLPYIAQLIGELDKNVSPMQLIEDLKWIFPVFVEDFINHVYKEEDTLFNYILQLDKSLKRKLLLSKIYFAIRQAGLHKFADEHELYDEELHGISKITNGYHLDATYPVHLKVILCELRELDHELHIHASIENEILFPKALILEQKVLKQMAETAKWN